VAQPIPLDISPRDGSRDLRSRLERAPDAHAEAVLAAYEVLQQLHDRGVLEFMRGALAASDDILQRSSTRLELRRRFVLYEICSFGNTFSAASSRNGSRVSSRRFQKV
jgi:hypothetical protein